MPSLVWVPGAVVAGVNINLPGGSPLLDRVISATITRIRAGLGIPDHAAEVHGGSAVGAHVFTQPGDHPVHAHDFAIGAGVVAAPGGTTAGGNDYADGAGGLIPGAGATGVQDIAAPQGHAGGAVDAHAVTQPNDHPIVVHGALTGTNPVVAAVALKVSDTIITLDVNTTLGDILGLVYEERGARLHI